MRKWIGCFMVFLLLSFGVSYGASPEDAKSVVKEFISYAKTHGIDAALKEVRPDGLFGVNKKGEAYIFVIDEEGNMVAHGANSKLAGKNLMRLKDIKGKYFIKEMLKVAREKGAGFVEYYWVNPKTKKISKKVSYVEKFGNYIVGAGVYTE